MRETNPQGWATLYDGVGSVKRHLEFTICESSFFSSPKRIFSLSCISAKARFVNPAVEFLVPPTIYSITPKGSHDSFFRRRDRSREQGAQSKGVFRN
jgi:hypothetical protein